IGGDLLRREAVERPAERVPLAQHGQPREPGLERLEHQLLVHTCLVPYRKTPLGVVVLREQRIALGPSRPDDGALRAVERHALTSLRLVFQWLVSQWLVSQWLVFRRLVPQ